MRTVKLTLRARGRCGLLGAGRWQPATRAKATLRPGRPLRRGIGSRGDAIPAAQRDRVRRPRDRPRRPRRRPAAHRSACCATASRTSGEPPRSTPARCAASTRCLISHLHYDHLDMPSLQRLGREMPVVAPDGAGGDDQAQGGRQERARAQRGGARSRSGALDRARDTSRVTTPRGCPFGAKRRSARLRDRRRRRSVYFAGDTDVFDEMADLAPVDVALLPIWGWGPTMGPGHMDPERAAEAAALLGAARRDPDPLGHVLPDPPRVARPAGLPRPRRRRSSRRP